MGKSSSIAPPLHEAVTPQAPSTPMKKKIEDNRKVQSESKKDEVRKRDIAASVGELLPSQRAGTEIKKGQDKIQRSGTRKKLFSSSDDIQTKPKYDVPYYLESFLFFLKATFDEPLNQHLLSQEDRHTYSNFRSLAPASQQLYVRLFSRKFQWRRRQKIVYPEIGADLSPMLQELCASGFLHDAEHLKDLPELIKLLSQPELKSLFKEVKLPFTGKANALEVCAILSPYCLYHFLS